MTRAEIVHAVAEARGDAVLVMGPGKSTSIMWSRSSHPASIYNMELAYASPFALGLALGAPAERVIAFEGDGSMYAATPTLGTIARQAPPNFTLVVLANGVWGTSDGTIEVTVPPTQFPELAAACMWDRHKIRFAAEPGALRAALRESATEPGPWFIVAQAERGSADASLAPDGTLRARVAAPLDLLETVDATRRWLHDRAVK